MATIGHDRLRSLAERARPAGPAASPRVDARPAERPAAVNLSGGATSQVVPQSAVAAAPTAPSRQTPIPSSAPAPSTSSGPSAGAQLATTSPASALTPAPGGSGTPGPTPGTLGGATPAALAGTDGFVGGGDPRGKGALDVPATSLLPSAGGDRGQPATDARLDGAVERWLRQVTSEARSSLSADDARPERDQGARDDRAREALGELGRDWRAGDELPAGLGARPAGAAEAGARAAHPEMAGSGEPWAQALDAMLRGSGLARSLPEAASLAQALQQAPLSSAVAALPAPGQEATAALNALLAAHLGQLAEVSARQSPGRTGGSADPAARGAAAADLGAAEHQRLALTLARTPPGGATQPVLSMIAANIFRLQAARQDIIASLRVADEDGELPPLDEEEAQRRRSQVQGVDLGGMYQFDRTPEEREWGGPEAASPEFGLLGDAIVVAALQDPYRALTMFHATDAKRGVRLFLPARRGGWEPMWVHLPAATATEPEQRVELGALASWLETAQQAALYLHRAGHEAPREPVEAAAYALAQVTGRPATVWGLDGAQEAKDAWAMVRRCNAPSRLPALLLTTAEPQSSRLKPDASYGILGGLLDRERAVALVCERLPIGADGDPAAEPWQLQLIPLPVLVAAARAIVQAQPPTRPVSVRR